MKFQQASTDTDSSAMTATADPGASPRLIREHDGGPGPRVAPGLKADVDRALQLMRIGEPQRAIDFAFEMGARCDEQVVPPDFAGSKDLEDAWAFGQMHGAGERAFKRGYQDPVAAVPSDIASIPSISRQFLRGQDAARRNRERHHNPATTAGRGLRTPQTG